MPRNWLLTYRVLGFSLLTAAIAVGAVSCGEDEPADEPRFEISAGAGSSAVKPFDFGTVKILQDKKQVFTVTNNGKLPGTVTAVGTAELKLADPFTAPAATAENGIEPCTAGMELAPAKSCLISVTFAPSAEGHFSDTIELTYKGDSVLDEEVTQVTKTTQLLLTATGQLDCSLTPELADARADGVKAANDQMVLDAARGKADGEALTEVDGYNDGYAEKYNVGYNDGYSIGYSQGKSEGFNVGKNDIASCNSGHAAGQSKGFSDGSYDGDYDGYNDGYSDGIAVGQGSGYNDGYDDGYYAGAITGGDSGANDGAAAGHTDGYNAGYADGEDLGYSEGYSDGWNAPCGGFAQAKKAAPAKAKSEKTGTSKQALNAADYVDACYNQGYDATYSTDAYWDAYNKAKEANEEYKAGRDAGRIAGYNAGKTAGTTKGHTDGYADGLNLGKEAAYDQCYAAAYPQAYNSAYNLAYNNAYDDGLADGIADAYDQSYNSGYNSGYDQGYDANYDANFDFEYGDAYDAWYNPGFDAGYDAGYSTGFQQGQFDTCNSQFSFKAMSSMPARIKKSLELRKATLVIPAHVTPAQPATSTARKHFAKGPADNKMPRPTNRRYGKGRSWWTTSEGHGVSTYVKRTEERLPEAVLNVLTSGEVSTFLEQIKGRTEESKELGSLREFIRLQSQEISHASISKRPISKIRPAIKAQSSLK